jgi:hypothetical protein
MSQRLRSGWECVVKVPLFVNHAFMPMIHPWAAWVLAPHRHEQESLHSAASHVKYRLKDGTVS